MFKHLNVPMQTSGWFQKSGVNAVGWTRAIGVASMLFASTVAAQSADQSTEVTGNLAIEAVTVYPSSAIVTRSGQVNVPAGASVLVINNLPARLDPARLQLSMGSSDIRLGNLQIQEIHGGQLSNAQEGELRQQLTGLQDERQAIVDRIATAESALRLLDSLSAGGQGPVLTGDQLSTLLGVMSQNSAEARERIREANVELREADQRIEQVQFELDQIATAQAVTSQLRIALQSDGAVTTDMSLSYPQQAASWSWAYEARLDTDARQLDLFRQASVVQGTGEDWADVTLTLSTTAPSGNVQTPDLRPQFVDLTPPVAPAPAPALSAQRGVLEEAIVTGSFVRPSFDAATVVDTRYQLDYVIPGQVTLNADRQPQVFPVDRNQLSVELVSRTVPSLDARAYLEARFDFGGESPFQSAQVQLYRDGAFIGSARSPEMLPGQTVRMPFGIDQRIEVQRFDEQQDSRNAGIFGRSDVREERIRYEITSRHPAPVELELLDRIPVSRHADISVSLPREATSANDTDVDGEAGLLLWRLHLAPQQTETVRHYYDVRHPRDANIHFTR